MTVGPMRARQQPPPPPPTPWLPRLAGLTLAFAVLSVSANTLAQFEHIVRDEVAFAFFVPLVIGHAGNCGGQTVATVVRMLECVPNPRPAATVIATETGTSALSTGILGLCFVPVAFAVGVNSSVVVTAALSFNVLASFASLVGASACYGARAAGLDPAHFAGPFVTTFVDLFGVLVYFGLADMTT